MLGLNATVIVQVINFGMVRWFLDRFFFRSIVHIIQREQAQTQTLVQSIEKDDGIPGRVSGKKSYGDIIVRSLKKKVLISFSPTFPLWRLFCVLSLLPLKRTKKNCLLKKSNKKSLIR